MRDLLRGTRGQSPSRGPQMLVVGRGKARSQEERGSKSPVAAGKVARKPEEAER